LNKSYSEEREEIQNSIKKYRGAINGQIQSGANVFKNSGKNVLLGVTAISVAIIVGSWLAKPKNNYSAVNETGAEEEIEEENEKGDNKTIKIVKKSSSNSLVTMIKNELVSSLVTLLKENIAILLKELPHILANYSSKHEPSEKPKD